MAWSLRVVLQHTLFCQWKRSGCPPAALRSAQTHLACSRRRLSWARRSRSRSTSAAHSSLSISLRTSSSRASVCELLSLRGGGARREIESLVDIRATVKQRTYDIWRLERCLHESGWNIAGASVSHFPHTWIHHLSDGAFEHSRNVLQVTAQDTKSHWSKKWARLCD